MFFNRCKSRQIFETCQNPWPPYDNTYNARCKLKKGHPGSHNDNIETWTDATKGRVIPMDSPTEDEVDAAYAENPRWAP